ncbi:hypothetical protein DSM112329_01491 [Paraconexibacter sp. AEG42_29]|uniref:Uncharacterized protein n=1 Tax=Paraconexibacter sp. AEG42_29 TaxID=2997339 RepID=A0AAU7ASQ5_9ACTN
MNPTDHDPINADARLVRLGDALTAAAVADLERATSAPGDRVRGLASPARRTRRRPGRRGLAALALALVAVPGAAVAASGLLSPDEVARSLPNGTLALLGTDPTCTTIRADVEYDCTLRVAPTGDIGAGRWKGTVEPSVDDTQHINGGCRSLNAAGTHWRCYTGEEAVRRQIIGPALLGQRSSGPGVG